MIKKEKEKKREERKERERKKKKERKEKKMGEMVGDQTVNQTSKPLKKGEKKNHQFWNSRIAGLVVFSSLVSSSVCVCLLGTLEPNSGGPSRSLVDHLSGKPVELGPAKPKRLGSWQVGG
jgi:hypothetical protein